MRQRRNDLLEGWPIVGLAAILVAVWVGATLALWGTAEAGILASIRMTASSSLLLFLAAFVASAACVLRPTPLTKWLLRNRRQLGLSFAVSQLAHLTLIALLVMGYGPSFWRRIALTTIAGGSVGYVFTAAMAITSFDRTAAWLGRARWRALHKAGMYVIFGIFFFTYAPRYGRPRYVSFTVLLLLALALRIAAKQRSSRRVA